MGNRRRISRWYGTVLAIFTKGWFLEGLFYSTFIAIMWTNEEPSKINTIFVGWSAYAIVAVSLFYLRKSGAIIKPEQWIRVYFIQSFLLLLVCDFVWLQGSVARTTGPAFDPIRFDAYAVILAESGMSPQSVTFQNYTGTIWYAGLIYWIFGVSKFYVAMFNGALAFVSCVLFASVMGRIEGNPYRWQWLCFGMLLPDFIYHFSSVSKEPLCVFVVALGIWTIAKAVTQKKVLSKFLLMLIAIVVLGLAIRSAVTVIIFIIAVIWFWKYANLNKKVLIFMSILSLLLCGQIATDFVAEKTGSMTMNWMDQLSILTDPGNRMRKNLEYPDSGSWNVTMESVPVYFMPLVAPAKGFFMMIAPPPLNLHIIKVFDDILFKSQYGSPEVKILFSKTTAMLFIFSLPFLLAAMLDTYRINRKLWFLFPFTFAVLISFMGFAVYGMIEPRYRPMLLPIWLVTAGIGYYYGRPNRYIMASIGIIAFGGIIYILSKLF